jgi:hypothetical protein
MNHEQLPAVHDPLIIYAFLAAFLTAAFLVTFAGRLLPKDPLKRFPFAVFLSPLPMIFFILLSEYSKQLPDAKFYIKKARNKMLPAFFIKCKKLELFC